MTIHQERLAGGLASARIVASTGSRLLLASASTLALQAVMPAGPANAVTCVTSISTTANPDAVQTTSFVPVVGVPFRASNFSAITSVTGNNSGATDHGDPNSTACGTNANANGLAASAYGSFSTANGALSTATGGNSTTNGIGSTATGFLSTPLASEPRPTAPSAARTARARPRPGS